MAGGVRSATGHPKPFFQQSKEVTMYAKRLPLAAPRGFLRVLVRGLCLLLATILSVAVLPAPAWAGGYAQLDETALWAKVVFQFEMGFAINPTCRFAVRYEGEGAGLVWGEGECDGGYDTSPGYVELPEPGSRFVIDAVGIGPGSQACEGIPSGGTLGAHPDDGYNIWSTVPAGSATLTPIPCQVIDLCMTLYTDDGFGESSVDACVEVDDLQWLEDNEADACPYGYPKRVEAVHMSSPYQNYSRFTVTMTGNTEPGARWAAGVVTQAQGRYQIQAGHSHGNFPAPSAPDWTFTYDGQVWDPATNYTTLRDPMPGFQVWYSPQYPDPQVPNAPLNMGGTPDYLSGGSVGLTVPSSCTFYIGTKIVDVANTGEDEPWNGLGQDVEPGSTIPDPPPLGSDDNDPADEQSFWNEVLALLAGLAAAVLLLPKLIVDGITAALSELFVPAEGFLNAKATALKAAWRDTVPGQWVTAITGQTWTLPAGGCEGVPLNFSLPGDVAVDEQLGAACSGTMANVAAVTKLAGSVGLVVFGGLACVRALGSGFGWNPGIGKGAGGAA